MSRIRSAVAAVAMTADALLETPQGDRLGTLCVIDTVARPNGLTEVQAAGLRALARQVMAQLELRRAVRHVTWRWPASLERRPSCDGMLIGIRR